MRKIFNKMLAGVTSAALVATLLVGISVTETVKADETPVTLTNWTFLQGGQFNKDELWNTAYINSVVMNGTNETIGGWLRGNDTPPAESDPSFNQTQTAMNPATGFTIDIDSNSQDKDWANDMINPWAIRAELHDIDIEKGHMYTVSFKAHASKKKYCYVAFGCDVEGTAPYGDAPIEGDRQLIALGTADQTYTYTFSNYVSATKLSIALQLGAFNSQYDFGGNNVSDIITSVESMWGGIVYVSDFTITDKGVDPNWEEVTTPALPDMPTEQPTTKKPTVQPTTKAPATVKKLAKAKKLRVKNNKKGTIKISWKKVTKAKKYQVKVGKKTYNTKKTKLTVKKLKKGKKYTVKVRAKATGYKTSAWVTKKVKIKK